MQDGQCHGPYEFLVMETRDMRRHGDGEGERYPGTLFHLCHRGPRVSRAFRYILCSIIFSV
jgi:hypothetical protein